MSAVVAGQAGVTPDKPRDGSCKHLSASNGPSNATDPVALRQTPLSLSRFDAPGFLCQDLLW
jgi:hypothetical protein